MNEWSTFVLFENSKNSVYQDSSALFSSSFADEQSLLRLTVILNLMFTLKFTTKFGSTKALSRGFGRLLNLKKTKQFCF